MNDNMNKKNSKSQGVLTETKLISDPKTPSTLFGQYEDEMFSDDDAHMLSESDVDKLKSELTSKAPEKYIAGPCIGKGGMKVIMKAKDKDTSRDIALAVMRKKTGGSKINMARFIREARITANLEHPNIIPVHDIGIDNNGNPYFTMKLAKGETFAEILEELRNNNEEYVEKYKLHQLLLIFRKVCNAVAFAHSKGIIHLDLTPENIHVGRFGEVLVLDWGLAKMIDWHDDEVEEEGNAVSGTVEEIKQRMSNTPASITMDGVAKGTPGYMAPEQAAGHNKLKDQRTDIYALGAILYSILTWEVTIENDDIDQLLDDTIDGKIIPPKLRSPKRLIPNALEAIAMKSLDVDADERYQRVMALRSDIDAYISGRATVAERAGLIKKVLLFMKRHKLTVAFVSIIILLLSMIGRYVLLDDYIEKSNWKAIYKLNDDVIDVTDDFVPIQRSSKLKVQVSDGGIDLVKGEALFIKGIEERENVKLRVVIVAKKAPFEIKFYINSSYDVAQDKIDGYILHFGDEMYLKKSSIIGDSILARSSFNTMSEKAYKIIFQKVEGVISVYVNGKNLIYKKDDFSLIGNKLNRIGIKSLSDAVTIKGITVCRIPLFDKVSPLIAGDSLVEAGAYREAVTKYLYISNVTNNDLIAQKALIRAHCIVKNHLGFSCGKKRLLNRINEEIKERYPRFIYSDKL